MTKPLLERPFLKVKQVRTYLPNPLSTYSEVAKTKPEMLGKHLQKRTF